MKQDPLARAGAVRVRGLCPQEPERDVRQDGAEHGGVALDVQAVAPVGVLLVAQVPRHLRHPGVPQHGAHGSRYVTGDDKAGHEEHRATVVPGPVAVLHLELLVEVQAARHRLIKVVSVDWRALVLLFGRRCRPLLLPLLPHAHNVHVVRAALLDPQQLVRAVFHPLVPSLSHILISGPLARFQFCLCARWLLVLCYVFPYLPTLEVAQRAKRQTLIRNTVPSLLCAP